MMGIGHERGWAVVFSFLEICFGDVSMYARRGNSARLRFDAPWRAVQGPKKSLARPGTALGALEVQVAMQRSGVAGHEKVNGHQVVVVRSSRLPQTSGSRRCRRLQLGRHHAGDHLRHRVHRGQRSALMPDREVDGRGDVQDEKGKRYRVPAPLLSLLLSPSGRACRGSAAAATRRPR